MNDEPLCDDQTLDAILNAIRAGAAEAPGSLAAALSRWPRDARLHFLSGSVKASARDYGGAERDMAMAVALAPAVDIYRFQLGFLQLSSGDGGKARATLQVLEASPSADPPLKLFSRGLIALADDNVELAMACLSEGIQGNARLPELNHDMGSIVDNLRTAVPPAPDAPAADAALSTHLLLSGYWNNTTKH